MKNVIIFIWLTLLTLYGLTLYIYIPHYLEDQRWLYHETQTIRQSIYDLCNEVGGVTVGNTESRDFYCYLTPNPKEKHYE